MFAKSTVVAAALAASVLAFAPSVASAETQGAVGVSFGYGGGYGDYDADDYQDVGYGGVSCWKGKEIVRWQGFKHVVPYDCSAPIYKYKAWKHGEPYRVRVNWKGYIVGVKPL